MKNMTVAVYESNPVYGRRLADYISSQKLSPFVVHLYLEHPVPEEIRKTCDMLLITSSLMDLYPGTEANDRVMILDEEGEERFKEAKAVYKYQSAAVIYRELLDYCAEKTGKYLTGSGRTGDQKILGIYTPVVSEASVTALLERLRDLGSREKVLYMNFEQLPVFTLLLPDEPGQGAEGMSEVLYYLKQKKKNLGSKLMLMCRNSGFDYLLPALIPQEMDELTEEDWVYLRTVLTEETDYTKIFLDFGAGLPPADSLPMYDSLLIAGGQSAWEEKIISLVREIWERMTDREWERTVIRPTEDRMEDL